jgi:hypothetical protein
VNAIAKTLMPQMEEEVLTAADRPREEEGQTPAPWKAVARIACFFTFLAAVVLALGVVINSGLRRIKTSEQGSVNHVMAGKVNAQIVITGSSRASSHYDPRVIQAITGRSAFNSGLNGTQTDVQVSFLKAYLEHNRKPQVVIHNLDAFTFVTSRYIFNESLYLPYLRDQELYAGLRRINPGIWKARYLPVYGYVVEDMQFSWILGIRGFLGWSPREDYFLGFNPRSKQWTDEFQTFKAANADGVKFAIEPAGVEVVKELIQLCHHNGIQLILVYSPEYTEVQSMTNNRREIFRQFHELANRYDVPFWDYSDWKYAADKRLFQNSQHLNAAGANQFSQDLARRLRSYFEDQSSRATTLPTASATAGSAAKQD